MFLYHFRIIKAIFNRLNLRLSQKITHLDTFLNKLCSSTTRISFQGIKLRVEKVFPTLKFIFHEIKLCEADISKNLFGQGLVKVFIRQMAVS